MSYIDSRIRLVMYFNHCGLYIISPVLQKSFVIYIKVNPFQWKETLLMLVFSGWLREFSVRSNAHPAP